jgi:uncharacterized membrane protein
MKDQKMVRRSNMKAEDLGLKIIDDRSWLLRQACHGDPVRSLWMGGRPLPLCSRCITFYPSILLGIGAGILIHFFIDLGSLLALIAFAILITPLVLDGWTQYIGLRTSNNTLRALTGALAGAGIGFGITYMMIRVFF